jgi:hypothetical protein
MKSSAKAVNRKIYNKYVTVGEYDISLLEKAGPGKKISIPINGIIYEINLSSNKLLCFKESRNCYICGIEGVKLILQRLCNDEHYHFNLYTKSKVLMNKDHVIPKFKGGKGSLDNLKTTCYNCNVIKNIIEHNLNLNFSLEEGRYYSDLFSNKNMKLSDIQKMITNNLIEKQVDCRQV